MPKRETLYPHVPKSRKIVGGAAIWPPLQKFLDDVRSSIPDEIDGCNLYRGMAATATALGLKEWGSTLEQMASDENRHRISLEEILKKAGGQGSAEKLPQVIIEAGETVPPKYRDLIGYISEPLPREAE